VYGSQPLSFVALGKPAEGKAKVRTGFGKSDRPGSQGGLRKRGQGSRTEAHRESGGYATGPYRTRAVFLSRSLLFQDARASPRVTEATVPRWNLHSMFGHTTKNFAGSSGCEIPKTPRLPQNGHGPNSRCSGAGLRRLVARRLLASLMFLLLRASLASAAPPAELGVRAQAP
jgi:hypothetical protein